MHVTLRGLARTLQVTSRRDPRGALRVTLRVPREASRAAYDGVYLYVQSTAVLTINTTAAAEHSSQHRTPS